MTAPAAGSCGLCRRRLIRVQLWRVSRHRLACWRCLHSTTPPDLF